jgi:sugar phosphate isomerase/epimerase
MNWGTRISGIGDEAASGLHEQLTACRQLGLSGIELRTVNHRWLHELALSELAEVAAQVNDSGLSVPMLDTPIGGWSTTLATPMAGELESLRRYAQAAHVVGSRRLRVMSYPNDGRPVDEWREQSLERMRQLSHLAEELDVVLLHENCHGWAGQGATETLLMLREIDSPYLRLVFDLGNGIAYGYEALDFLSSVLPWVDHVHVKDGRATAAGAVFTIPGQGEVDLVGCIRALREARFLGEYSLEPHVARIPHLAVTAGDADLVAGFAACVEGFRRVWSESLVTQHA